MVRREYIEDAVLVLGGAAVIAAAWIVYWPAGLLMAGVVMTLMAMLAHKHRLAHMAKDHTQPASAKPADFISAAAWRFHVPSKAHDSKARR